MTDIIGAGEMTLVQILTELFPTSDIKTQVKLGELLRGDYHKTMSDGNKKQTLDVVMYPPRSEVIVCRVQGKDHMTMKKSSSDGVQERILKTNKCRVVDFWYYECVVLFTDKKNKNSEAEVNGVLQRNGIRY